jgi:hypothetical protein
MAEVSAAHALVPADRTVPRHARDNSSRTNGSLSFRVLVQSLPQGPFPARGPEFQVGRFTDAETSPQVLVGSPQSRTRRDPEATSEPEPKPASSAVLDPLFCQLAMNPWPSSLVQPDPAPPFAEAPMRVHADLQGLLAGLARRAAWGGDRRKGSARIELSEGALAGATLVVHTEQRSVSVELELPAGVAALGLQERLVERLEARGFAARVTVG